MRLADYRARAEPLYVELARQIALLLPEAEEIAAATRAFRDKLKATLRRQEVLNVGETDLGGAVIKFHRGLVLPALDGGTGAAAFWDRRRDAHVPGLPPGISAYHD
jgi:hypothetical protein